MILRSCALQSRLPANSLPSLELNLLFQTASKLRPVFVCIHKQDGVYFSLRSTGSCHTWKMYLQLIIKPVSNKHHENQHFLQLYLYLLQSIQGVRSNVSQNHIWEPINSKTVFSFCPYWWTACSWQYLHFKTTVFVSFLESYMYFIWERHLLWQKKGPKMGAKEANTVYMIKEIQQRECLRW